MVRDGDVVALEGFTHLIPFAAGHEIIRQGRRNLTLIRMTPDLIYDQLIGAGCASKLMFSWGGNPGVGSLHRLRDAVEKRLARSAGARRERSRRHGGRLRGRSFASAVRRVARLSGTPTCRNTTRVKFIECPFTGEKPGGDSRHSPGRDHHSRAEGGPQGNVLMWGVVGVQKEAVLAAKRAIVTVEEIVDELDAPPNAVVLPSWVVGAVCEVKGGAFPSYAQGYYPRNNAFYKAWDAIARERETFQAWMRAHVLSTKDFDEFSAAWNRWSRMPDAKYTAPMK